MKKYKLAALVAAVSMAALGTAHANTVIGSVWENVGIASGATIANEPGTTPDATFTLGTPFDLDSTVGANGYTIGGYLASNPGGFSWLTGSGISGDPLDNSYWFFTGQITVTNGEVFHVEHDDGLQLNIGGTLVVDQPGPTSAEDTPYTWNGLSGTYAFTLSYGECCGPPAVLATDLPLSSGAPEASTWAMMIAGFCGLGFAGFRASRRREAIA
jgi:hypothetical protein